MEVKEKAKDKVKQLELKVPPSVDVKKERLMPLLVGIKDVDSVAVEEKDGVIKSATIIGMMKHEQILHILNIVENKESSCCSICGDGELDGDERVIIATFGTLENKKSEKDAPEKKNGEKDAPEKKKGEKDATAASQPQVVVMQLGNDEVEVRRQAMITAAEFITEVESISLDATNNLITVTGSTAAAVAAVVSTMMSISKEFKPHVVSVTPKPKEKPSNNNKDDKNNDKDDEKKNNKGDNKNMKQEMQLQNIPSKELVKAVVQIVKEGDVESIKKGKDNLLTLVVPDGCADYYIYGDIATSRGGSLNTIKKSFSIPAEKKKTFDPKKKIVVQLDPSKEYNGQEAMRSVGAGCFDDLDKIEIDRGKKVVTVTGTANPGQIL
ncbi:unnamed protein product, partial [Cuscuta europaea]